MQSHHEGKYFYVLVQPEANEKEIFMIIMWRYEKKLNVSSSIFEGNFSVFFFLLIFVGNNKINFNDP